MSELINNALLGKRKALEQLYGGNSKKVYFVANCLLDDEKHANEATVKAFESAFASMGTENIKTEKDFSDLVVKKVSLLCRKELSKNNAKAFKVPDNRNFMITGTVESDCNVTELSRRVFEKFSAFQKFIYILNNFTKIGNKAIASILKTDIKTVEAAISAESSNIERISHGSLSVLEMKEVFEKLENTALVSETAEKSIKNKIFDISAPFEKKRRKKSIIITSIVLAVCIIVTGVIVYAINHEPFEGIYLAEIEVEDYGTIKLELDSNVAPITVENFVDLAESGFYDGLTFHRIMSGFMIQGGDPDGNGTGGSDTEIYGEFAENGFENNLSHKRGVISMARSNDPNSASSQFFIVHKDNQASLDGKYAAFGWVTSGMDVVDAICADAKPTDSNGTIPADKQPIIKSVKITGKR